MLQKLFSPSIFNKDQTPNSEQRSIIWNSLPANKELHLPLHYHKHEKSIYPLSLFVTVCVSSDTNVSKEKASGDCGIQSGISVR